MLEGRGSPIKTTTHHLHTGHRIEYVEYTCSCNSTTLYFGDNLLSEEVVSCFIHGGEKHREEGQQNLFPVLPTFKDKKRGRKN